MRTRMWCAYPSATARNLASALGILRLKRNGSRFRPNPGDTILNWGSTGNDVPFVSYGWEGGGGDRLRCLNHPVSVYNAVNKSITFKTLREAEVRTPAWTTNRDEAVDWLGEGCIVVCRAVVTGHGARGLSIVRPNYQATLPPCPLYTKYVKKEQEYRVHVMNEKVIYTQKKLRRLSTPNHLVNWQVRNHANGFIYAQSVGLMPDANRMAIDSVKALRLDFGAVDMIRTLTEKWFVLEVNTGPCLVNRSLDTYVHHLRSNYAL